MMILIGIVALVGYGIAKLYRYYAKLQRNGLLEPPVDLLDGFKKEAPTNAEENDLTPNRNRYSKAQARQRFRKGKS